MKNLVFILVAILLNFNNLRAEQGNSGDPGTPATRKNSVYFELLGNGVIYSINYDRLIPLEKGLNLIVRFGGNEYHGVTNSQLSFNFIGSAGLLFGKRVHFFETSFGYTHFLREPDRLFTLAAGYRLQGRKGLVIRLTPMFIANTQTVDSFGGIWIGLSLGYSF